MAVTIMCPNLRCRKVLMVPTTARGNRVRCSYCSTVFVVPSGGGARSTPAPSPAGAGKSGKKKD